MNGPPELTVVQSLIRAAAGLPQPFPANALVVRAWEADRRFALKGYEGIHPDANRVLAALMGERGLVRQGWLDQVAEKTYRLSAQGQAEADRIAAGGGRMPLTARAVLPPAPAACLAAMLTSPAFAWWRQGKMGRQQARLDPVRAFLELAGKEFKAGPVRASAVGLAGGFLVDGKAQGKDGRGGLVGVTAADLEELAKCVTWANEFAARADRVAGKRMRRLAG